MLRIIAIYIMYYLKFFLLELDRHSNSILGCPLDVADTVLDDKDMYRTFRLHVFNRVLSDSLKSVGLKLRFTNLTRNERQGVFTEETCKKVYDHIFQMKEDGMLNDYIALDIIMSNMLGKLDCEIYLRDTQILNQ